MFKQITDLSGNEWYLITSLCIFLVFFVIVGILLLGMRKEHIDYMKGIPMDGIEQDKGDMIKLEQP